MDREEMADYFVGSKKSVEPPKKKKKGNKRKSKG
jgi:hypothetical protein